MSEGQIFVPLVTPLTAANLVCKQSVQQMIARTATSVTGYIPCLTSGEGWLLSEQQWLSMVGYTVEAAAGKPVIAGIERASTQEVLRYAMEAQSLGAKGVMLTTPFGPDVDQNCIVAHYREVHDGCGLDIYIYNESALSDNETSFDSLLTIAALPRVVGIKDSVEGGRDAAEIRALQNLGLAYFIGWEQLLAQGLKVDGNVVSLSNLDATLCRLGNQTDDRAVQAEIARLCTVHGLMEPDWYRHIKRALKSWGVISTDKVVEAR